MAGQLWKHFVPEEHIAPASTMGRITATEGSVRFRQCSSEKPWTQPFHLDVTLKCANNPKHCC